MTVGDTTARKQGPLAQSSLKKIGEHAQLSSHEWYVGRTHTKHIHEAQEWVSWRSIKHLDGDDQYIIGTPRIFDYAKIRSTDQLAGLSKSNDRIIERAPATTKLEETPVTSIKIRGTSRAEAKNSHFAITDKKRDCDPGLAQSRIKKLEGTDHMIAASKTNLGSMSHGDSHVD